MFWVVGDKIWVAYSSLDLMWALNSNDLDLWVEKVLPFLGMNPILEYACEVMLLICILKGRFETNVTPRSLIFLGLDKIIKSMKWLYLIKFWQ